MKLSLQRARSLVKVTAGHGSLTRPGPWDSALKASIVSLPWRVEVLRGLAALHDDHVPSRRSLPASPGSG